MEVSRISVAALLVALAGGATMFHWQGSREEPAANDAPATSEHSQPVEPNPFVRTAAPETSPMPAAQALADEPSPWKREVAAQAQMSRSARRVAEAALRGRGPEFIAAVQRADRERDQKLETSFRAETVDSGWANATAATLRRSLGEDLPEGQASVRTVDCRASSCRLQVESADAASIEALLPLIAQRSAGVLDTMAVTREASAAGTSVVVYLSR